jgi:hypothetical protein
MRILPTLLLGLACVAAVPAQEKDDADIPKRYGVVLRLRQYPQKTPKETLQSILKAFDTGQIYYLVAHLSDPAYVDKRVHEHKQQLPKGAPAADRDIVAFERVVKEVTEHFRANPALIRDLQQLGREGEGSWEVNDEKGVAAVRLKGGSRGAYFRKMGDRWFLENHQ